MFLSQNQADFFFYFILKAHKEDKTHKSIPTDTDERFKKTNLTYILKKLKGITCKKKNSEEYENVQKCKVQSRTEFKEKQEKKKE